MVVEGEGIMMNNQESTEPDSNPGCVWEEENRRLTPQKDSLLEINKDLVEVQEKEETMTDSSSDSSHASDNEDSDSDNSLLTSKEWAG